MLQNQEYKDNARNLLKGRYWNYVVAALIYVLISVGLSAIIPQMTLVIALFEGVLEYGFIAYSLNVINNRQAKYIDIFDAFTGNKFGKVLGTTLLVRLFTFLWSLLLVVPGIIKGLGWSMTTYILRENPDRTTKECMKMSEDMMMGHKWEYFKLQFSFFGWYILAGLTAGLGLPLLLPFVQSTVTLYYEDLKNEYNKNQTVKVKVENAEETEEQPKLENKEEK